MAPVVALVDARAIGARVDASQLTVIASQLTSNQLRTARGASTRAAAS